MVVRLIRRPFTPDGTFGDLIGFDFDYHSLEKPWVDLNGDGQGDPQTSCISPAPGATATYRCEWRESPHHGWCYEITNVLGRSHILIHPANWQTQLLGCIALGKGRGVLNGKPAILRSADAIKEFNDHMARQPFDLNISWSQ